MMENVPVTKKPLSRMRQRIRDHMVEASKIPQFSITVDVEMDLLLHIRASLDPKPSITACLLKACALALVESPEMNGFYVEDEIAAAQEVNIGIAVSIPDGLIVPVIKHVDQKDVATIGLELAELSEKAKTNSLSYDDIQSGTFTVTNLGMLGVKTFTPLLNPPQIGILAVGSASEAYRKRGDDFEAYRYVNMTLTADHRAIDGAGAARFLINIKRICEEGF